MIKKLFSYHFYIVIFLFLQSCVPYSALKFVSDSKVESSLPPLNVIFDETNFLKNYGEFKTSLGGQYKATISKFNKDVKVESNLKEISYSYYSIETKQLSEPFLNTFILSGLSKEIEILIKNEFSRNVSSSNLNNLKKGTLKWYVEKQKTKVNPFWAITSLATLFSLNLIGYPVMSQTTELNLVITILDSNSNEIISYNERGKGTGYSAMYWGYEAAGSIFKKYFTAGNRIYTSELTNVAQLKAIADALEKIKVKIQKDATQIEKKLSGK